jgi:hypothetical protein
MNPPSADRPQPPRTFTSNLRHVARRPLLIIWLAALGALVTVVQVQVPQPWSITIVILIVAVVTFSLLRSLNRDCTGREDPAES